MHAQMTHITPLVHIRRRRTLDRPGDLLVRSGQKVNSRDAIVSATIPTRHYLLDVFRSLRLSTPTEANTLIKRKVDEILEKNDIIAETGGAFSRVIRTPGPGRIVSIHSGRVLIEAENRQMTLLAGMAGVVTEILPNRGVVIDTDGSLLQGVWGNEKTGSGPLEILIGNPDGELKADALGLTARGNIILAGYCTSMDGLNKAVKEQVAGIILGSMSASLVPDVLQLPYPVILMEGFGKTGINPVSKKLLLSCAGREVSLMAQQWDRQTGDRPEVIITLPADGEPYVEDVDYKVGQTARIHSGIRMAQVGVIQKLIPGLKQMPSGLRASCASIKFINNEIDIVPLANIDIIEVANNASETPIKEEYYGTDQL